jgi:hypothetical protein
MYNIVFNNHPQRKGEVDGGEKGIEGQIVSVLRLKR